MSVEAYNEQTQRLSIERRLLRIEAENASGRGRYTPAKDVLREMSESERYDVLVHDDAKLDLLSHVKKGCRLNLV